MEKALFFSEHDFTKKVQIPRRSQTVKESRFITKHLNSYQVLLDERLVFEHDLLPLERGRLGPLGEGGLGHLHHVLHLALTALRDLKRD